MPLSEAAPVLCRPDNAVTASAHLFVSGGGTLRNRDGKFGLKYLRVNGSVRRPASERAKARMVLTHQYSPCGCGCGTNPRMRTARPGYGGAYQVVSNSPKRGCWATSRTGRPAGRALATLRLGCGFNSVFPASAAGRAAILAPTDLA